MNRAKTLSLVAALALLGCAQSTEPAATGSKSEQPAGAGEAAATQATAVIKVDGMS